MHVRVPLLALVLAAGCAPEADHHGDHAHPHAIDLDAEALRHHFADGEATFRVAEGFRQVGLMLALDGEAPPALRYRADDGPWRPVEITWQDGRLANGRILLDRPATTLALRGGERLRGAFVELSPTITAPAGPLARDLPVEPLGTLRQAIAPRDLVIPRAEWGARDPGRICGDVVSPYRMSVHHTASPADDGGDPAVRMRQIQAFHIDSRGWCDIGYHFVVSQSGLIFQGRSDETRPGAHVGNQNSGNVGICLIGNFEEQRVGEVQFDAAARIMGWVGRTYGIPFERRVIKGHREWPGQQTACPGNDVLARFDELIARAANGGAPPPPPPPPPPADVDFRVEWLAGPPDRVPGDVPEAVRGESLKAAILVTNRTGGPMRGVRLAYRVDAPYLAPTHYVIQTDHPARDQSTWMTNDADAAPENPPKEALGGEGELTLYAFGNGETKRVVIDLGAAGYSIGRADPPRLRAWLAHADEIYADQEAWNQAPATNRVGRLLQGEAVADVLAPDAWTFDGAHGEGWRTCADASTTVDGGALRVEPTGSAPCLAAPEWTAIDADRWEALVVRTDFAQAVQAAVEWDAGRVVFEGAGTLVVPLAGRPGWGGTVRTLRLTLPPAGVALDAIGFQSADGTTSGLPFADAAPVRVLEDLSPGPEVPADPEPEAPRDMNPPIDVSKIPGGREPEFRRTGGGDDGCAAAPGGPAGGLPLLLLALLSARRAPWRRRPASRRRASA